jgi:hypothetical protein
MRILPRPKPLNHDQEFELQLRRAAAILARQPWLRESQLAHALAAQEGTTAFDTICAAECAMALRGWLCDRRTWPEHARAGGKKVA